MYHHFEITLRSKFEISAQLSCQSITITSSYFFLLSHPISLSLFLSICVMLLFNINALMYVYGYAYLNRCTNFSLITVKETRDNKRRVPLYLHSFSWTLRAPRKGTWRYLQRYQRRAHDECHSTLFFYFFLSFSSSLSLTLSLLFSPNYDCPFKRKFSKLCLFYLRYGGKGERWPFSNVVTERSIYI